MSVARGNCLPPVTQCVLKRDGHGNSSSGGDGKGAWHWHWHRTSVVPARIRSSALRPSPRSRSPGSQPRHGPTGSLPWDAAADAPHHAEDAGGGGGKSKTRGYSRRGGQFCCGGVSQTAGEGRAGEGGRRSQAIRSTMTSGEICKYKGLPVPIYRGSTGSRRGQHLGASLITAAELLPLYGSQINYSEMRNLIQNLASRTRGRLPRARALASSALGLRDRRRGLPAKGAGLVMR